MNDSTPPPVIAPSDAAATAADLAERQPIANSIAAFEAVLRQPRRIIYRLSQADAGDLIGRLILVAVTFNLLYGLVVGSFSGGVQWWAAPVKITGGLVVTALICLPSLYILACLGGSRATLREIAGLVAGLVALMSILLIGFAPVAWVFSQSTESVATMGMLHILFALIAVAFGLRLVETGLASFGGNATAGLRVWTLVFLFVLMQMTTALRPLVGTADTFLPTEKKFFLSHWWDTMDDSGRKTASQSGRAADTLVLPR